VKVSSTLSVAGLFAGIGGVECGLQRGGHETKLLCEYWEPAKQVLKRRFPDVELHGDVRSLEELPAVDLVAGGFPCTDLSQAGRTAGIAGSQSGLVSEVFRLVERGRPDWLVLENVRNMLPLDRGRAMDVLTYELERLGYAWAYRVVDSRFAGVPQRRQRVLVVASRVADPRHVLLADDAGEPTKSYWRDDAFGFYWTEGLRGLGWAQDAVPTLKGGSTVGIPSPPGVWLPDAQPGRRLVTPTIDDAEAMQGFRRGWTAGVKGRAGTRWKLVGNAVTVGVSAWLGRRLADPGTHTESGAGLDPGDRWPNAAWGHAGKRFASGASMWPVRPATVILRR
jgi:DNA (cytosine-5)-methyltransferase 1